MMNFWISLYVTVVITIAGSAIDGVQISRIGSQDEIRTQVQDDQVPSKPHKQTLPTPPDEQQSQDPGTNLTKSHFQVPDPPTRMYPQQYPRLIYPTKNIDQTPPEIFVRPHEFPTSVPNRFGRQFPTGKNNSSPLYYTVYNIFNLKSTASNRHPQQASSQPSTHKGRPGHLTTSGSEFESGYLK